MNCPEELPRNIRIGVFPGLDKENPVLRLMMSRLPEPRYEIRSFRWSRAFRDSFDIVHVHWPDGLVANRQAGKSLVKVVLFLAFLRRQKARGAKVVFTVHNTSSHEGAHPRLERMMWEGFVPMVDLFIHLNSSSGPQDWPEAAAGARHAMIRHPDYAALVGGRESRRAARLRLGLPREGRVFLFFGQLRSYKGIELLLRAFSETTAPDDRLLILGRPVDDAIAGVLEAAREKDGRILLELGFIAQEELNTALAAATLVVLPYRRLFNSGAALMALSAARPVLAPGTGMIADLRAEIGAEWIRCIQEPLDGAQLIATAEATGGLGEEATPDLSLFTPEAVGARLDEEYRRLLADSCGAGR